MAIVRLGLIPTRGDDKLDNQRAVFLTNMIEGKMFVRSHKKTSALLFPYLITELCRQENVPIIRGVDSEI